MSLEEEPEEEDKGAPAWMATFSDLATLLLTFFVLLLSFAEMDVMAFKTMLGSVKDAFGVQKETPGSYQAVSAQAVTLDVVENPPIGHRLNEAEADAVAKLQRIVQQLDMQDDVDVFLTNRGVSVRLKDRLLFSTASDDLAPEAAPLLDKIGELAEEFPGGLSIEGHTDDRPIRSSRFPSNWELSSARATAALRYLRGSTELDVDSIRVVGFADTKPVVEGTDDEARSKNRRVEFVFQRDGESRPGTADGMTALIGGDAFATP